MGFAARLAAMPVPTSAPVYHSVSPQIATFACPEWPFLVAKRPSFRVESSFAQPLKTKDSFMTSNTDLSQLTTETPIAILGLGHVGLPLAHAFGKLYPTVGFDINSQRIKEIKQGLDSNNELTDEQFNEKLTIEYSDDENSLADCDIYIITAPTPVDEQNQPDLGPVKQATRMVAKHLGKGNNVVFESTVYPGATEE